MVVDASSIEHSATVSQYRLDGCGVTGPAADPTGGGTRRLKCRASASPGAEDGRQLHPTPRAHSAAAAAGRLPAGHRGSFTEWLSAASQQSRHRVYTERRTR